MSSSMWGYFILLIGVVGFIVLLLFGGFSSKNEQNYYSLKEVTEGAMMDSIDQNAYDVGLTQIEVDKNKESIHCVSGQPGTIRIVKEKFVENFIRRFAENSNLNTDYKIIFYDIDECPPKVSLKIVSKQESKSVNKIFDYNSGDDNLEIINNLNAILESKKSN